MSAVSEFGLITGIGQTAYSRKSEKTAQMLAVEATLAATRDAGIPPDRIDGILSYPGHIGEDVIIENLNLPDVRFRASIELGGVSAVSSLRLAAMAVLSGAANHVLLLRALKGSSGARKADRPSFLPGGRLRSHLEYVHGLNTPAQRYALMCQRYQIEYGLDRMTLGNIAIAARRHANLNPAAQMHGRGLTMDEYLAGRPIADPYTLFDCSLETDGACAVIVSGTPSPARDSAVRVLAVGESHGVSPIDLSNRDPFLSVGLGRASERVWNEIGMSPSDMDAAMIYDCFTFECLHQLEEAGFAPHGRGHELVADGGIELGGRLPVNTHGGLLSEGHMGGLNHVVEAVRQIRGEAGRRQIDGARLIAVSGWGQLGDGSFGILGGMNV